MDDLRLLLPWIVIDIGEPGVIYAAFAVEADAKQYWRIHHTIDGRIVKVKTIVENLSS